MKNNDKGIFAAQTEICKALANAKRLEIIHLLAAQGRQLAAELMAGAGLTKTNLSQYMRVLKQAGIVAFEREGTKIRYELTSPKIGEACETLHEFLVERFTRYAHLANEKK